MQARIPPLLVVFVLGAGMLAADALLPGGIHRFTRNPMYLGFAAVLAGWVVYLGSYFGILSLPLYVLYMNRFQFGPEERALSAGFGEAYEAYRRRVRRWF